MGLLMPYQARYLADKSRFKAGMFARQTGKTFTTTLEATDDVIEHEVNGGRTRWIILSRGERQAFEALNEGVRPHMRAYGLASEIIEFDLKIDDATHRAAEVLFPGGGKITALPANPDTARGFSANTILDEFAFHKDSRAIWSALFPVISKPGLKLRVISTPNGKKNKFYEIITGANDDWSRHIVDINQAVAEGLPRDIEELHRNAGDEDLWRQEFLLEFLEESSAWLTYDMITACEDAGAGQPEGYQGGRCFIGNDIARRSDLWVAWVWELIGDVMWTREIVTLKNASFAAQDAEIARLMGTYNVERLVMDQTGMGEKPVEDMKAAHGHGRLIGMHLAGAVRMNVASTAKMAFEDRRVRIPAGDPKLRADLNKIKKVTSETGIPRLIADRDGAGHADRAWAAMMGLAAADPFVTKPNDGLLEWYRQQAGEMHARRVAEAGGLNPMLFGALRWVANVGSGATLLRFYDDHEPIGPNLLGQLVERHLVDHDDGGRLSLSIAGRFVMEKGTAR